MAEIGKLARKHKVFFHTDVAQALGKVPIDVNAQYIDLMSMSGHKIYGPKGIRMEAKLVLLTCVGVILI